MFISDSERLQNSESLQTFGQWYVIFISADSTVVSSSYYLKVADRVYCAFSYYEVGNWTMGGGNVGSPKLVTVSYFYKKSNG